MTDRYIRITLVRSPIGYKKYQRVTAETLGLRKLHAEVVHRATPQILGMVTSIGHLLQVEDVDAAEGERVVNERAQKRNARANTVQVEKAAVAVASVGDDLTKIEGIGPKMSGALKAAGIDTFQKLADATEAQLRSAIESAGLKLAPGLSTWSEQATLAANGDMEGLQNLQKQLVGGRRAN